MPGCLVRDGLRLVEQYLGNKAVLAIELVRDESDSFVVKAYRLADNSGVPIDSGIVSILPAGSSWDRFKGWRAFFAKSVKLKEGKVFVVGLQGVVGHPTRGAYPVMKAYAFTEANQAAEGMRRIADRLSEGRSLEKIPAHGLHHVNSRTPEEHISVEASVLSTASEANQSKRPFSFRTLIMDVRDVPTLKDIRRWLFVNVRNFGLKYGTRGLLGITLSRFSVRGGLAG